MHAREKNASGAGGAAAAAAAAEEEEKEEEALGGAAAGCCSVRACVRADCEAAAVRLAQVLRLLVLVP
jgi:hypothetical protein